MTKTIYNEPQIEELEFRTASIVAVSCNTVAPTVEEDEELQLI